MDANKYLIIIVMKNSHKGTTIFYINGSHANESA